MLSLGRRYTHDEDKLIEWVNNGFLKVYKKIDTVKNPEALPGWIKSVISRSILDGIRSEKRYLKRMIFDLEHQSSNSYRISSEYDYDVIMGHVEQLPDSSKNVFKKFIVEGFSHKDISQEMGISEGTSKWHLNNARTKLKQILLEKKVIASGF